MTTTILKVAAGGISRSIRPILAIVVVASIFGITYVFGQDNGWLITYPESAYLPTRDWVGRFMEWLVKEFDLGLFTFQQLTRSIAWVLSWPFDFVNAILWKGFSLNRNTHVSPLSWSTLSLLVVILGWWINGWRMALLGFCAMTFLVTFGYWESAMKTFSSIAMVVPTACALGIYMGILGYRHPRTRYIIVPLLDFMQTVPIFAYLLPILFLFGFGPLSAMIATLIYAMPPMVRSTMLGLQTVPEEVKESGLMSGATSRQQMWRILIPSAKHTILVGLNQVIMLSLNAVIIASLIGAGGLGYDVIRALKSLRIGQGFEAGIAIVLLAIVLDRFSRAYIDRKPGFDAAYADAKARHSKLPIWGVGIAILLHIISLWIPALQTFPEELVLTTGPFWDSVVDWILLNHYETLSVFKNTLLSYLLLPGKKMMLSLPWPFWIGSLITMGYLCSGRKLAITVGSLALLILVSGFWEKAIITTYLISVSVLIALLFGIPLGILASMNDRTSQILRVLTDTLQTLPSFVYLIPVVMLFQAGDVSALIAVVLYAIAPVIRYTDNGLRQVPPHLVEAATAIGLNRWQVFTKVKRVLAFPEILLGINQTIMLAISMLVITALVGTRDLGQEVYIGLARADTGRGLVAGICVACIAIIADRLLQAYAVKEKRRLGID